MSQNIVPAEFAAGEADRTTVLQRLARKLLLERLAGIHAGRLEVIDGHDSFSFGGTGHRNDLCARVEVLNPQFWADAVFGGSTGAGEAYIHGLWRCDDLTSLVRLFIANREVLEGVDGSTSVLFEGGRRLGHWLNRNSKAGSRKNIAAHYDLGNDMFRLFLDPTMNYSCGIFEHESATMEQASVAKMDALCRKLDLTSADHLLEIGTGWGGLAMHAAQHYGCRVTTTTISREQHALAAERVRAAGLQDRVTLLLKDYRDLSGTYDKLVSVEMIEAVGHHYLDDYFAKCGSLLKPDGLMALQAITIADQFYAEALKSVDFIKRFVFPGSFIPSVSAMTDSIARSTDLRLFHLQDIGPHYATTLAKWRERFFGNAQQVRALGYPESFLRLWEFYLCYCEGGFLERHIGDVQMVLSKPGNRRAVLGY
jgi:cyclopropane-fatty-acyl-phospholipid synthase